MKKTLSNEYLTYLDKRPLFYSFIRPQEALFFQKYLPLKKPILDFGCGDGFFASVAFGKQIKIDVGVDVNEKIKNEAIVSRVYKKVVIYEGNKLPFDNEYFSTIVSNCVLEHIPDLENCLCELNRVLKKGGKICLTVATDQWEKNLLGGKFFGNIYKKLFNKILRHHNLLSQKQWKLVFERAGFKINKVIPYMSKEEEWWCEVFLYLSFPNFISKKIFNKWVIADNWPLRIISERFLINKNISSKRNVDTSCLFFCLDKK